MKTNIIDSNIFLYFNCILFKYFDLNYKKFLVTFDVSNEVNITLRVYSFWLVLYSQVILTENIAPAKMNKHEVLCLLHY